MLCEKVYIITSNIIPPKRAEWRKWNVEES
jgi:hypothetical protein